MNVGERATIDEIKRAFPPERLLSYAESRGKRVTRGAKPRLQCPNPACDPKDKRACSAGEGSGGEGWFKCNRCGAAGSIIDFLMAIDGLDVEAAILQARELSGQTWEPKPRPKKTDDEPLTADQVQALWDSFGTDGPQERAYLRGRQLERSLDGGLWRVNHQRTPSGYASWCARQGHRIAMAVRNPFGELVSMQFRCIGPNGKLPAKLSLKGASYGNEGFFGDPIAARKAPRVHIAEGMADTAAVWQLGDPTIGVPGIGQLQGVLACLGNVRARTFVLYPQNDAKRQSQDAFDKLEAELRQRGAIVRRVIPSEGYKDVAEWNADVGPDALKVAVDSLLARPVVVPPAPEEPASAGGEVVELHPGDDAHPDEPLPNAVDERPQILLSPDIHLVNAEAVKALAREPSIFQRNNLLVHVVRDLAPKSEHGFRRAPSSPRIIELSPVVVQDRLSRCAAFYKWDGRSKGYKQAPPPKETAAAVAAFREWEGIRGLRGFTEVPVLTDQRGTILQTPGYDLATGLLYEPTAAFLPVPETPTLDDARAAVSELLDDVMGDFPWEHPSHRAAWLGMLLTLFARHAFDGPAPVGIADANIRGAGKGLMVDSIAMIFSGRIASKGAFYDDDAEMNKQITSVLLAGDPLVLLDDVDKPFGGSPMQKLATTTSFTDRILGGNDRPTLDAYTVWFVTGNNLVLAKDMARRVLHMRLRYEGENPEDRTNFKHPLLLPYIRENRPRFVRAALTILRAYCLAGCPEQTIGPWGSFEGWSRFIRHCVVWLGLNDPRELAKELERTSDSSSNILRDLVFGLDELRPGHRGLSAREVIQRLEEDSDHARHDAARSDIPAERKHLERYSQLRGVLDTIAQGRKGYDSTRLGNKLRDFRDRHVDGGKHIAAAEKDRTGAQRWTVVPIGNAEGAEGAEGSPVPDARNAKPEQQGFDMPFPEKGTGEAPAPSAPSAPTPRPPMTTPTGGQVFERPDLDPDDDGR